MDRVDPAVVRGRLEELAAGWNVQAVEHGQRARDYHAGGEAIRSAWNEHLVLMLEDHARLVKLAIGMTD